MGDLKIEAMTAESGETTLQVCSLTPTERAAEFFLFLRSAAPGAAVQLEPLDTTCYRFTVSASTASLIQAVLQSAEFFPSLIRIEANGALEIRLAGPGARTETPVATEAVPAPAPPVEVNPAYHPNGSNGATAHEDNAQSMADSRPASAEVSTPEQPVEVEDASSLTGALERLDRRVGELLAGLEDETASPAEDLAQVSSNGVSAAPMHAVEQQNVPEIEPENAQGQAEVASDSSVTIAGEEPAEDASTQPAGGWWTPRAAQTEQSTTDTAGASQQEAAGPQDEEPVTAQAEQMPPPFASAEAPDAATGDAQAAEDPELEAEPGRIEVVAHPFTSFNTLDRFVTLVSALPDVRAVALRRFRNGTLRLAVDYDGTAPLVDHLKTIHEIPIEVIHDDGALIELAVQEAAVEAPSL